ncbi:MAG TPA: ATP-binding protein [Edaphocola sp.]|nr:ATP-binding protein [Edaphocola sp.]
MKLNYRQRLFLYFSIVFAIFTIGIVVFVQIWEKSIKTNALEEKLEVYTDIINNQLKNKNESYKQNIKALNPALPVNLRLTLINLKGDVIFDNIVNDFSIMENHLDRPEMVGAKNKEKWSDIRLSETNQQEYLYYAKRFKNYYIRVALPYNIQLQHILQPGNSFLYFMLIFFALFILIIHFVTFSFGKTIKQLRDFVLYPDNYELSKPHFPKNELGEIGDKMTENYFFLKESKSAINLEKQKLLQHIQISEEGICFISSNQQVEFYNGLFIQNLNSLTDQAKSDATIILTEATFIDLHRFIKNGNHPYFETKIQKSGKTFILKANYFEDKSLEIILSDITKQEKTKLLKREMTGNISHELRTPITSIRGYLETILNQSSLAEDKKNHFIQQAFNQAIILSEIIRDMSLIAKMEEAPHSFEHQNVNLQELLKKLKKDISDELKLKKVIFTWEIPIDMVINGNSNLLYSIFRNLADNSLRYAGENININIRLYNEDDQYYYFSFYDTGIGIQEENHLNRLFERFYRVNEGRTRETGGSGLGLSIVKNAIAYHKGKITIKNRVNGGLEYLFFLHK